MRGLRIMIVRSWLNDTALPMAARKHYSRSAFSLLTSLLNIRVVIPLYHGDVCFTSAFPSVDRILAVPGFKQLGLLA
ncbi:hypothetical protein D3C76_1581830 [compost metagenome]